LAHELEERRDGGFNFVFNGQAGRPWHRLGTQVEGLQTADIMLKEANADYEVWTEPVFVKDARTGELVQVDNRFATVRVNPDTNDLQPFEVFTDRYTVMQNREVLEKALEVVGASNGDAVIDTLGVMFKGAQFFACLDLGGLIIDPMGAADEIARYLMVKTSHDGSSPLIYANTDIRVVCNNTCRLAEAKAKSVFKARHTPNAEKRLVEAQRVLGLSTKWAEHFKEQAEAMLQIPVPRVSRSFDVVMDALWPMKDADTDRKKRNRDEIVGSIEAVYANERNAGRVGFNGWGLYNAIVEHQDWHRAGSVEDLATAAVDESGLTSKRKRQAHQAVMALAN
jgi:phage/plasmid-like protein (TIGR03299 family)